VPAALGARAALASGTRDAAVLAVGSELIGYTLSTGKVAGRAAGPGGTISDLAWTADGAWLVAAAGGKAFVLDAKGGVVRALPVEGSALHVATSPDGAHTAIANDVGAIALFGSDATPRTITPSLQPAEGLAFAGSLLWVAGSDGTLRAFDATSGEEKKKVDAGSAATRLALSPDGLLAAVAGRDRTIRIFALPDGTRVGALSWHPAQITALAWGAGLLSGDGDGNLAAWDVGAAR
jgi:WD40 repeat protein